MLLDNPAVPGQNDKEGEAFSWNYLVDMLFLNVPSAMGSVFFLWSWGAGGMWIYSNDKKESMKFGKKNKKKGHFEAIQHQETHESQ